MSDQKNPEIVPVPVKFSIPTPNILTMVMESFGLSRTIAAVLVATATVALIGAIFFFVSSAPPSTLTITSGPEGSVFYTNAWKYAAFLKTQGIKMKILPSNGSLQNLKRLAGDSDVDVGFVQAGITNGVTDDLFSLGSISYQPLLVFYRGDTVTTLAGLAGKRLAIGPEGSGTRTLVLTLLETNGITNGGATTLLDWDAAKSAHALLDGSVDAVFLMGEDASPAIMRKLLLAQGVRLMNFAQAEAYTRKFTYLSLLKLPEGGIDLGKNIPASDVYLIGPTVELIARHKLHPALSDLLLSAAQHVNGNASLLQRKGEFPAPIPHDLPISPDATRFYKSGKSFFYQHLPFWLASLVSRIVVVFVPTVLVMIPVLRSIPHLYRWRNQSRIYRWYRALLVLEKDLTKETDPARREELRKRLDEIEAEVNKLKMPAFLANQFYGLREDIALVRAMTEKKPPAQAA
jgi:hypothetical protein